MGPEGGTYTAGATYPTCPFNVQLWIASARLADLDESAAQVAVIETDAGLGAVAGAVYKAESVPVAVMVPTAEFPLGTPLTVQLAVVSGCPVLVTVATS